jgi:sortase A
MRSLSNSLLIALGVVLVSTMLISASLDVRQVLPRLLPDALEIGSAAASPAAQLKFSRSILEKDRMQPATPPESRKDDRTPAVLPEPAAGNLLYEGRVSAPVKPEVLYNEELYLPSAAQEPAAPDIPTRLVIPTIELDAPIEPAKITTLKVGGEEYEQWQAPDKFAAGWHEDSAMLGQPDNTVLNGHHNIYGKVFGRLVDLNPGDLIIVFGKQRAFIYQITNKMILPEKYQEIDVRMDNARWILPSDDERLTLVTCWPATSNTHRLIIVARPLGGR